MHKSFSICHIFNKIKPMKRESRVPLGYEEYQGDRQFATTLARGLELLKCFSPDSLELGNKELSTMLQLPAATISRLTYTLLCMGYLVQTKNYGKYRLGNKILSLGSPVLESYRVRTRARPLMWQLAKETGGSIAIGVRDQFGVVCIEAIRADTNRVYRMDIGEVRPLIGTALGRACLMSYQENERLQILNQIQIRSPESWGRFGRAAVQSFSNYAKYGCCTNVGELFHDVQAVAIPMGRIDQDEPAALSCSFQGLALDENWLRDKIAPKLIKLVREIG